MVAFTNRGVVRVVLILGSPGAMWAGAVCPGPGRVVSGGDRLCRVPFVLVQVVPGDHLAGRARLVREGGPGRASGEGGERVIGGVIDAHGGDPFEGGGPGLSCPGPGGQAAWWA